MKNIESLIAIWNEASKHQPQQMQQTRFVRGMRIGLREVRQSLALKQDTCAVPESIAIEVTPEPLTPIELMKQTAQAFKEADNDALSKAADALHILVRESNFAAQSSQEYEETQQARLEQIHQEVISVILGHAEAHVQEYTDIHVEFDVMSQTISNSIKEITGKAVNEHEVRQLYYLLRQKNKQLPAPFTVSGDHSLLTLQEGKIYSMLVRGQHTYQHVAQLLHISLREVRKYESRINMKLALQEKQRSAN